MIRLMKAEDRAAVIKMMEGFYASEAVMTNGSKEIFENDVENCLMDSPYLEGYVFEDKEEIQGYAMIAKSFSTEFGKPCIWIEDLFIKAEFRGMGIASRFFDFIEESYPNAVYRLEAEFENTKAIQVYEHKGFRDIPYKEMIKR